MYCSVDTSTPQIKIIGKLASRYVNEELLGRVGLFLNSRYLHQYTKLTTLPRVSICF